MKWKHRITILAAIALALGLAVAWFSLHREGSRTEPGTEPSATVSQEEGKPKSLVMALDDPLDSACGKLALTFKENVETMSEGTLTIDIYENRLLGTTVELLGTVGDDANAADIILVPVSDLSEAGCHNTTEILEPYRFEGHDAFLKWTVSKEAATLLEDPEKSGLGVTGLFFTEGGFRYLFLRENSRDVKNKKIAAEAGNQGEAYVSQIGGEYVYMPSIDIKAAILDGNLDGAEQSLQFYRENLLWESAPYIAADCHMPSIYEAAITLEAAGELSGEELDILKTAGKRAVEASIKDIKQEEESMMDEFAGYGAKTVKLKNKIGLAYMTKRRKNEKRVS